MILFAPVSKIISTDFIVVAPDVSIGKAEMLMKKKGVRWLAVEADDKLKGIVTHCDFQQFKESLERDGVHGPNEDLRLKHHKVSEIMNTRLVKLNPDDSIKMASEIMNSIIFQVIPVVEKQKMIGVLTLEVIRKWVERENRILSSQM